MTNVNFIQNSFTNWAKGGYNNYALSAYIDGKADWKKDEMYWNNRLQLDYGFLYSDDKPLMQKNKDRIREITVELSRNRIRKITARQNRKSIRKITAGQNRKSIREITAEQNRDNTRKRTAKRNRIEEHRQRKKQKIART